MPISDLQLGLIGVGGAAVAAVFAYSKWQERKHRQQAERAFGSGHRDVLLEPDDGVSGEAHTRREPGEAAAAEAAEEHATMRAEPNLRRSAPELPEEVDMRVDCAIRIESIEPLSAGKVGLVLRERLDGLNRALAWYGFDEGRNGWIGLDASTAGSFNWFCAAMQMADRRGPIADVEFEQFVSAVQEVCDQFLAVPASLPSRGEALSAALELDRFCAGVDVQIGVNVVSEGADFAASRIRELAESRGLVLQDDGMFHAMGESGETLFCLGNLEPTLFEPTSLRELRTHGLTLFVDVPRTSDGALAFDRMMQCARELAEALGGNVVDDNRAPFGEQAAGLIRGQIQQFQAQMASYGVAAGGPIAMRLFAA
jgi:FtsZ-interacting cell division protein ZipA